MEPWNAATWTGCRTGDLELSAAPAARAALANNAPPRGGRPQILPWTLDAIPTYNQKGPSCVTEGLSNATEAIIRRYVDPFAFSGGWQLDGYRPWRWANRKWWDGDRESGLYPWQGMAALVHFRVWPPGTKLASFAPTLKNIRENLAQFPVGIGLMVDDGWRPSAVSRENGCLDHSIPRATHLGAHWIIILDAIEQNGIDFLVFLNSWGLDWGFRGLGLITYNRMMETRGTIRAYTFRLPDGWQDHTGWKDMLIKRR
jgi:hypothetical protein